jgi:cytochrome P450
MNVRSVIDPANLHDEGFARDPFPVWERLRNEAPLFHDTVEDVYLLTRYEDVTAVLRDDVTYSTWIYKSWFATVMGDTFAQYDGERHTCERARVAPHLVGAPLDRILRPAVEAVADAVVGALPGGVVDLIGPFTFCLPGLVMASTTGGPRSPSRSRRSACTSTISLSPACASRSPKEARDDRLSEVPRALAPLPEHPLSIR